MAAGAMQVMAPGARPLGQEEQHTQIKGCIQSAWTELRCCLEPFPAPTDIGRCSTLSV